MGIEDVPTTISFLDHGYWIKFKEPNSAELWIAKDKPDSRGMITGLWLEVMIYSEAHYTGREVGLLLYCDKGERQCQQA